MHAWLALRRCRGIVLALSLVLGLLIASASGAMPQIESPTVEPAVTWQPWHMIDTRTGHVVAFPEWIKALEQAEIIYLGEEHHNPYHIEAALKVLNQLLADRIYPTIGMEMFGWDGQEALDSYVSGIQSMSDEFLERGGIAGGQGRDATAPLIGREKDADAVVLQDREDGLAYLGEDLVDETAHK